MQTWELGYTEVLLASEEDKSPVIITIIHLICKQLLYFYSKHDDKKGKHTRNQFL